MSADCEQLIKKMLVVDPKNRITLEGVIVFSSSSSSSFSYDNFFNPFFFFHFLER